MARASPSTSNMYSSYSVWKTIFANVARGFSFAEEKGEPEGSRYIGQQVFEAFCELPISQRDNM